MFSFLRKDKKGMDNEQETPYDLYKEYMRLVQYGDDDDFLDVDTPLIVEYRDEIKSYIESGCYDQAQIQNIEKTDNDFKRKAKASASAYVELINSASSDSKLLKMILRGLIYDSRDTSRWWFHLVDDISIPD